MNPRPTAPPERGKENTVETSTDPTPITSSRRARQQTLDAPGMAAQVDNPEVEADAEAYRVLRDEHLDLTKRLKEAKTKLTETCLKHSIERYDYVAEGGEPMRIAVKTKHKVTVRKQDSEGADGDEDEE